MDKEKLIQRYKVESHYAFNLIPNKDIVKFVDMIFDV